MFVTLLHIQLSKIIVIIILLIPCTVYNPRIKLFLVLVSVLLLLDIRLLSMALVQVELDQKDLKKDLED